MKIGAEVIVADAILGGPRTLRRATTSNGKYHLWGGVGSGGDTLTPPARNLPAGAARLQNVHITVTAKGHRICPTDGTVTAAGFYVTFRFQGLPFESAARFEFRENPFAFTTNGLEFVNPNGSVIAPRTGIMVQAGMWRTATGKELRWSEASLQETAEAVARAFYAACHDRVALVVPKRLSHTRSKPINTTASDTNPFDLLPPPAE